MFESYPCNTERCPTGKLTLDNDRGPPPSIASVPALRRLATALQSKPLSMAEEVSVAELWRASMLQLDMSELLQALPTSLAGYAHLWCNASVGDYQHGGC